MSEPRRILVAGATGAIGRRLLPALLADGHTVFGLARSPQSAEGVLALGATPVTGDALDRDAVLAAVGEARPEVIVHQLTAIPPALNPRRIGQELAPTNRLRREGTWHLVEAAEEHGVGRLVAQSIAFAYRPEGPMVVGEEAPLDTGAKGGWGEVVDAVQTLEDAVLGGSGFEGVVLRFGYFYGPGNTYAPDGAMGELARARRLPIVGAGEGVTSFIHVDDAASATLAAIERGAGVFNAVDDSPAPAREWVPAFAEAVGAPPPRHVPAWLARIVAGGFAVGRMTEQRGASNAKIRSELGWSPLHPDWRAGFAALEQSEARV